MCAELSQAASVVLGILERLFGEAGGLARTSGEYFDLLEALLRHSEEKEVEDDTQLCRTEHRGQRQQELP